MAWKLDKKSKKVLKNVLSSFSDTTVIQDYRCDADVREMSNHDLIFASFSSKMKRDLTEEEKDVLINCYENDKEFRCVVIGYIGVFETYKVLQKETDDLASEVSFLKKKFRNIKKQYRLDT